MTLDRHYEEKRNYIRMKINSKAIITHDGNSQEAVCVDLSSSGMQLQCKDAIAVGQKVKIEIGTQHHQLSSLVATTEVIWSRPDDDGQGYVLGLTVLEMN